MSLGKGFGVGFRWAVGWLSCKKEEKGEAGGEGGEGGGWGGDRQRNRQVNAHAFAKTTFLQTTFSFSPKYAAPYF